MRCKWLSDDFSEICVNGECPACGDFCPCVHYPEICRWAEETGQRREVEGGGRCPIDPADAGPLPRCGGEAFGDGTDDG